MSAARQASASSNNSCSARSALARPMPKEIARRTSPRMSPARAAIAANRVEPHRHVAAADVEANTGNADLTLVGDHPTNRLGIAQVAVSADHAGDSRCPRPCRCHLRQRRLAVLAEDGERRVAIGSFLRREVPERGRLGGEMFVARRLAELAPCRQPRPPALHPDGRRGCRDRGRRPGPVRGHGFHRHRGDAWSRLLCFEVRRELRRPRARPPEIVQSCRQKSAITAGVTVSNPTTSSIPASFGSAMLKPLTPCRPPRASPRCRCARGTCRSACTGWIMPAQVSLSV